MAKTNKTRVKEHMREHGFAGTVRSCTIDKTTGGAIISLEVDTSEFNLLWLKGLAAIFNTEKLELSCNCDCDCGCGGSTSIDLYDATLPWETKLIPGTPATPKSSPPEKNRKCQTIP